MKDWATSNLPTQRAAFAGDPSTVLGYDYFTVFYSKLHHGPRASVELMSATDFKNRSSLTRSGNDFDFTADSRLGPDAVSPTVFNDSGFDAGHTTPWDNYVNWQLAGPSLAAWLAAVA